MTGLPKCHHTPECFEQRSGGSWACRECERVDQLLPECGGDRLEALQRRGDELEAFFDASRKASRWIGEHGTGELVEQLRDARKHKRRIRLGAINALVLLAHIDRLEAEIAKEPLVLP